MQNFLIGAAVGLIVMRIGIAQGFIPPVRLMAGT